MQVQSTAELLRRYRRAAGLTQEELAERAAVSARSVSDIERGISLAPHRSTLDGLADALRLTADERDRLQASVRPARGPQDEEEVRFRRPVQSDRHADHRLGHLMRWTSQRLANVVTRVRRSPAPIRLALSLVVIGLFTGVAFKVMNGTNPPGSVSAAQAFVPWHVTRHTGVITGFTTGLALDRAGNVYFSTSYFDPRVGGVWKVAPSGQVLAHWGRHG